MAVTFDAVGPTSAGQANTNVASFTWTHTVAAGPCAVVVGVGCSTDGSTLAATCGGVSMTSLGKVHNNFSGTSGFTQLFGLANVSTGAKTIVVSGGGGTDFEGGSLSYAGADTVTPFGTAVTAPASAVGVVTAGSVTVAGTTAGNLVTGVCSFGSATISVTGGASSRWVSNAWTSSAAGNAAGCDKAAGGSVTLNWADTSGDWYGAVGVEVKAGAGGGGASPVGVQPQRGGRTYRRKWDRPQQPQFPSQVIIPTATVTAGLATGTGAAAVPVFGNYIIGLAGSGNSYFITNQGTPQLLVGDNPWCLIPNAGRWGGTYQTDLDGYCNGRGAQGFTAVYLDPFGNTINGGAFRDGRTWDGVYPFTSGSSNDPSSGLNNTFWQRVDYFVTGCARNNMCAMINIGYDGGSGDIDTGGCLAGKTSTQYTDYGTALAGRYASTPNIIWVVGNDYFGESTSDPFGTPYSNILTGLRNAGDTHAITIHNNAETTSRYDFGTGGANRHEVWGFANAQFNGVYTYERTYFGVEYALAETSPLTTIWIDGYFYSASGSNAERAMRQFHWWAVTSGARGTCTGSEAIWQWPSTALASVTTGAWYTTQNAVIRNTVEPLANWQNLQASPGSAFITAGRGTRFTGTTSGGGGTQYGEVATDNYISACLCADGSLALIYFSAGTAASTITIDQTKMATGYTATWVDPASGAQTSGTAGATYANHGTNSVGARDWVLILQGPSAVSVTAGLASGTGTAQGNDPAIGVNAAAATEAGAALSPAAAVAVNAAAATEAGAALGAVPAVAVNAVPATGTGAALGATASTTTAGTATAGLASGTGAALNGTAAIGVTATAATEAGAALSPAVTTAASPAVTAATGTGAALGPAVAITITAVLAAGTGAAPGATAAVAVTATLPSGAGAALNASASTTAAGTANATAATGTGAALGPAVASAASPAASLAAGTGAALSPAAAVAVPAAAATGTGAAQSPAVTATASPAAVLPSGAGAALNATASTSAAGTANAGLASGTGTAAAATPAAGVNATLASGAGTALNATVSTASFTNAQAGLATGAGAARQPSLTLTANATATPATGTGTTASAPATGVNAPAASGAGTARNATGQAGWVAPAGLAAGTATAQSPAAVLVATAQAAAAAGLGAALRAAAKTVTYGTARQGTLALAGAVAGQQAIPHAGDGQMPLPHAEGGQYP